MPCRSSDGTAPPPGQQSLTTRHRSPVSRSLLTVEAHCLRARRQLLPRCHAAHGHAHLDLPRRGGLGDAKPKCAAAAIWGVPRNAADVWQNTPAHTERCPRRIAQPPPHLGAVSRRRPADAQAQHDRWRHAPRARYQPVQQGLDDVGDRLGDRRPDETAVDDEFVVTSQLLTRTGDLKLRLKGQPPSAGIRDRRGTATIPLRAISSPGDALQWRYHVGDVMPPLQRRHSAGRQTASD